MASMEMFFIPLPVLTVHHFVRCRSATPSAAARMRTQMYERSGGTWEQKPRRFAMLNSQMHASYATYGDTCFSFREVHETTTRTL